MRFHPTHFLLRVLLGALFLLLITGCQTAQPIDSHPTPKTQSTTSHEINLTPDDDALIGLPEAMVKDLEPLRPYILRTIPVTQRYVFYPMPDNRQIYSYQMLDLKTKQPVQIRWRLLSFQDDLKKRYFKQPMSIGRYYEREFNEQSKSYFVLHTNSIPPMMVMQSEHTFKDKVITYFEPAMLTQPMSTTPGHRTNNEMKVVVKDEKSGKIKHTGQMTQTIEYMGMYQLKTLDGVYEVALISATIEGKVGPAKIKNRYHGFHHPTRGLMAEVAFEEVSAFLLYNDKTHRVLLFNGEIEE